MPGQDFHLLEIRLLEPSELIEMAKPRVGRQLSNDDRRRFDILDAPDPLVNGR